MRPPPPPPPKDSPPPILRGALRGGAAQLIGRCSGLIRDVIFTATFGAGMAADAFFAALRVPNLLRELLAEGTLANIFVPLFAEEKERGGLALGWALTNAVLGILLIGLGLFTLLFVGGARWLVLLVAAGFASDPDKLALTISLTRIVAPFLAGISIASLFGGMLNVQGRFFLPALAPSLLNFFVIVACLGGNSWEQATGLPAIHFVAWAATASGVATAAMQYPTLRRAGYRFRPTLSGHPALSRIFKFMGAALIGVFTVQFNLLVETQLASRFGDGPVSYLILGFRFVQIPMGVVAASVAVANLASLSVLLARDQRAEARTVLSEALSLNALLVTPCAVGLYLLADPLVALFFERGAFTPTDTAATAGILRMYATAIVGICMYRVLLPVFFALKDPYVPMRLSLAVMAAKLPIALGLVYGLGMGIEGLPLSHTITVSIEVLALLWVLTNRMGGWSKGFWNQLIRIGVASIGMGLVVAELRPFAQGWSVVPICAFGAALYGCLALLLRIHSARTLLRRLNRRRIQHYD